MPARRAAPRKAAGKAPAGAAWPVRMAGQLGQGRGRQRGQHGQRELGQFGGRQGWPARRAAAWPGPRAAASPDPRSAAWPAPTAAARTGRAAPQLAEHRGRQAGHQVGIRQLRQAEHDRAVVRELPRPRPRRTAETQTPGSGSPPGCGSRRCIAPTVEGQLRSPLHRRPGTDSGGRHRVAPAGRGGSLSGPGPGLGRPGDRGGRGGGRGTDGCRAGMGRDGPAEDAGGRRERHANASCTRPPGPAP